MQDLINALSAKGARPVFLTGAGVSLASGIPTFRGPDPDAVWTHDVLEKATPDPKHTLYREPAEDFLPQVARALSIR